MKPLADKFSGMVLDIFNVLKGKKNFGFKKSISNRLNLF